MTFRRIAFAALAALVIANAGSAEAASVASENRRFNAIVSRAVQKIRNDFVDGMSKSERRAWNACVRKVFAGATQGQKRKVLAGRTRSEQEARLRTVSQENHAAIQQQITREC